MLEGGPGNDSLGGGYSYGDTVDFSGRSNATEVVLDDGSGIGSARDMVTDEFDQVFGIYTALGGSGDDVLTGSEFPDRLVGGGGDDVLNGKEADDRLEGEAGADDLTGAGGRDTLLGGAGGDYLDSSESDGRVDASILCGSGVDLLFSDLNDTYPSSGTDECEVVAPTLLGRALIDGQPTEGSTLTARYDGSIAGTSSTPSWQWWRCGEEDCAAIPGAGNTTYTLTGADVDSEVGVVYKVENDAGSDEIESDLTPVIAPIPAGPSAPTPPATSGLHRPLTPSRPALRSVRCGRKRCRIRLSLGAGAARVRAELRRGNRRVARVTRRASGATLSLTVRPRTPLKPGVYRLSITVTRTDKSKTVLRRKIRIR